MKTITKQHTPLQNENIKGDQFKESACVSLKETSDDRSYFHLK
jgi:hypothetical protein